MTPRSEYWVRVLCNFALASSMLGLGIWQYVSYEQARDITRPLRWTVCNTTQFAISNTGTGILTITSELPSPCQWTNLALFQCQGLDDATCLRDNTNRFRNSAWTCIIHAESAEATNCNIPVWADWPDVTRQYNGRNSAFVCFVFSGIVFGTLLMIVFLEWRQRRRLRPAESPQTSLLSR